MKDFIRQLATEIGFAAAGFTSADPADDVAHLAAAAREGRIASMRWLARDPARRCDPRALLPGARSVVCCALAYGEEGIAGGVGRRGVGVARFARGAEYHEVVRAKLGALWAAIAARAPGAQAKCCVDTSPILEKALAERAGLGWIGKHTVLVNEALGSWFVLGEIITDLAIEPDAPAADRCGNCCRCLEACPTRALAAPRLLDARKCVSYLTIENRPSGPGGAYGCDACLEACPYNAR